MITNPEALRWGIMRIAPLGAAAYVGLSRWRAMALSDDTAHTHHERRLRRLIRRLPNRVQAITRWLRRPASRWARIPAGVLLICGGFLSVLPFFGLWMLPFGLVLLADDVPFLRRARGRVLAWLERRRPRWFAASGRPIGKPGDLPPLPPAARRLRQPDGK